MDEELIFELAIVVFLNFLSSSWATASPPVVELVLGPCLSFSCASMLKLSDSSLRSAVLDSGTTGTSWKAHKCINPYHFVFLDTNMMVLKSCGANKNTTYECGIQMSRVTVWMFKTVRKTFLIDVTFYLHVALHPLARFFSSLPYPPRYAPPVPP